MRVIALLGTLIFAFYVNAQTPAAVWDQLKAKRDNLTGVHQEFEISKTQEYGRDSRSLKWGIVVDMSMGLWRETSPNGFGSPIRIFDGKDVLSFEEGASEYVRMKHSSKDDVPLPAPYKFDELDWSKAVERDRTTCGFQPQDRACVVLDIPMKTWLRPARNFKFTRLVSGAVQVKVDTETGLLVSSHAMEVTENETCTCRSDVAYLLKRQRYGAASDVSLFKLPASNTREVKELPRWSAARIRKELAGKPAPEIAATDLQGTPVALSAFKGKILLLDFWATWCPPCRADAPALRKLYQRYGGKDLAIIGIAFGEDRKVVERFLKEHPAGYPIVLTSENEVPRPFQVSTIPTYIVIDENGLVQTAIVGDQGFEKLRRLLEKAGLEAD